MSRVTVTAVMPALLMACQTLANDTPALLMRTGDALVVADALERALGTPVSLAHDAFVTKSWLVVEPGGRALGKDTARGRDVSEPRRLELRLAGEDCVVWDSLTDKRIALPKLECRPE